VTRCSSGSPAVGPVVTLLLDRPPTLGGRRLVCVDGPAGSGKTTFAAALVAALRDRALTVAELHMDDLYDGWEGLPKAGDSVRASVVEPLARGRPGSYRRYDWHAGRFAERHVVPPSDVLVVEGVGSAHPGYADVTTVVVWVEVPDALRFARALERDGETLRPHWESWVAQERLLHATERTRERADLLVDGANGSSLTT
jgi:uridine kinase